MHLNIPSIKLGKAYPHHVYRLRRNTIMTHS